MYRPPAGSRGSPRGVRRNMLNIGLNNVIQSQILTNPQTSEYIYTLNKFPATTGAPHGYATDRPRCCCLLLSLSRQGQFRRPSVTTVDSTPPEVYRSNVVICPELIDPSATGTAWAASPLTAWWSTERWVDMTVECLVGWKWNVV